MHGTDLSRRSDCVRMRTHNTPRRNPVQIGAVLLCLLVTGCAVVTSNGQFYYSNSDSNYMNENCSQYNGQTEADCDNFVEFAGHFQNDVLNSQPGYYELNDD